MNKSIYTYYKERLVEIGGGSKCIYLKGIAKRNSYDLGRIFEGRDTKVSKFVDYLWSASARHPFAVISKDERREILENINIESRIASAQASNRYTAESQSTTVSREEQARIIDSEILKLRDLSREADEIEHETGKCELFVGYPFVFGSIKQNVKPLKIKAPLLLFPVKIEFPDADTAQIRFNEKEKIHINPALIHAYAQSQKINIDRLELDFDSMDDFRSIKGVIEYLGLCGIKIDFSSSKNIYNYSRFKEPNDKIELSIRFAAVLGRFPLSNSIYNDYTILEKQKLTNSAIEELLKTGKQTRGGSILDIFKKKRRNTENHTFTVNPLDFAQSEAVRRIDECGSMVVLCPPGTGKSQTIVNVITDAISKGKKILVVSQKKAVLDVVFNRLDTLNEKCMYVTDECKEKAAFYERCLASHLCTMGTHTISEDDLRREYVEINQRIDSEKAKLDSIFDTLNKKRDFGLSLSEMYTSSVMLNKNSGDYEIYKGILERGDIMSLGYKELSSALFTIKDSYIQKTYFDYVQSKEKNPLITLTHADIDVHTLNEVKGRLEVMQKAKRIIFDTESFPYFRQVLAHYRDVNNDRVLDSMVKLECKAKYPKKLFIGKELKEMRAAFVETINAVEKFSKDYSFLRLVFNDEGFVSIIDNLIRGNTTYMKLVFEAINTYVEVRDVRTLFEGFNKNSLSLLAFAYSSAKNYQGFVSVIESILPIRIYHEVIHYEEACKEDLARAVDYPNIKSRIIKLLAAADSVARRITSLSGTHEYAEFYGKMQNNKDYLYQISKKQKFWPIRKMMEVYGDFLLSLFPCWLLSPENVSSLLPLKKNMFDLVIFDEASQTFIESAIPAIFRGKNIIALGDPKQLRPSSSLMKRYLGHDAESEEDHAALTAPDAESLLDLAVSRYESTDLNYHYRSKCSELIDFSNSAFYTSSLIVAPNTSKNLDSRPIERIKIDGRWLDSKNEKEAERIVELLKDISKSRKANESIGIITFNSEQQSCIADKIERESAKNADFRSFILNESHRIENGEDVSMFIKSLENVQGDERDIIIFSIGYAKNADDTLYTSFGSLAAEGGENRLNVAITRAKSKIYVVTSIEPEELKVEDAKNNGPRLFKKYLAYARAVSSGQESELKAILDNLTPIHRSSTEAIPSRRDIAASMKEKLEKLGYDAQTYVGNSRSRISLAVYDKETDKYLIGVELDSDAYESSADTLERDVFKPRFLESRGWSIMRVWCRDYWLSPGRVIKSIAAAAEANK